MTDGAKQDVRNNVAAFSAGDKGTFYLDPNGMIIGRDLTESSDISDALYIVAEYKKQDTTYGTGDWTLYVQAVDMEGNVKELPVATTGTEAYAVLANYDIETDELKDEAQNDLAVKALVKAEYD